MRPIDADVLWKDVTSHIDECTDILEIIDRQPTVEPIRKKGNWHSRFYPKIEMYVCSECQHEYSYDAETGEQEYNFCPNCGADMRGG